MNFDKYEKYGAYHWRLYFAEEPNDYQRHVDKVVEWVKGWPVLDVGCGDGLITHLLGAQGIDDNVEAIKICEKLKVDAFLASAYDISGEVGGKYYAVFMGDVIEHLSCPLEAVHEARSVLDDGGFLYITTPPALPTGELQDIYHTQEYTPEELTKLVESRGFELVEPIEIANHRMYAKFRKV